MTKRPRWVAVCGLDSSGLLMHADGRAGAAASAVTVVRMGQRARGWKSATANLPGGAVVEAKRKRLLRGGNEFVFDRMLPPGTEIVFVGRPFARLPASDVQWWERQTPIS